MSSDLLRKYLIEAEASAPVVEPSLEDYIDVSCENFDHVIQGIENGLNLVVAVESLIEFHESQTTQDVASLEKFQVGVASAFQVAGLGDLAVHDMIPSLEDDEEASKSKVDGLKKTIEKVIKWIKEQFDKLVKRMQDVGVATKAFAAKQYARVKKLKENIAKAYNEKRGKKEIKVKVPKIYVKGSTIHPGTIGHHTNAVRDLQDKMDKIINGSLVSATSVDQLASIEAEVAKIKSELEEKLKEVNGEKVEVTLTRDRLKQFEPYLNEIEAVIKKTTDTSAKLTKTIERKAKDLQAKVEKAQSSEDSEEAKKAVSIIGRITSAVNGFFKSSYGFITGGLSSLASWISSFLGGGKGDDEGGDKAIQALPSPA